MSDDGLLYALETIEKLDEYAEKKKKEYHHVRRRIRESIWKVIEDIAKTYGIEIDGEYDSQIAALCNIVDDRNMPITVKQDMILQLSQQIHEQEVNKHG